MCFKKCIIYSGAVIKKKQIIKQNFHCHSQSISIFDLPPQTETTKKDPHKYYTIKHKYVYAFICC